mmetsp:Transcript_59811/g.165407  ORF Transcript_59811/g.165407 Transcript_59811/m.165407 type:complete len:645 (-) Transcript_59811:92-2026(-)
MQALRNLLGTGGQGVSLQTISDSLRNLPQEILRQIDSSNDGPSHMRGRVSGAPSYHFSLHFEPRSEGGGLCQTGVLVASATTRSDGGQPVPITCRWKRRIGAHLIEIPGIHGSMYHTSADDVGMDIVCQAEPASDSSQGQAYGVLGPFELDPITKMSLENLISSGASRFPVRHYRDEDDPHPRDLQIHVTQDHVKVVHPGAERGSSEVVAPYSADYPKVVIHPLDTCKFRLELSDEPEKIYHFVALSRTSRDLIALLIRCFHSRKYVATSFILSQLFQNPATPGAPLTSVQHNGFDVHGLGERLGKELDRTVGQLEAVERVVRNANLEKSELQAQLRETISSYTDAIEKLHQQLAVAKGGPAASLQLQLHEARAQQQRLQLEVQELKQRVEEEQQLAPKSTEPSAETAAQAEALRGEISQLRTSISALAGDAAMNSQRDLTRAEELRRLRSDVDMLNSEKEGLERCAMQADKDKQDLIENFLYVKGCLDRLQMASLQAPAASPEHEREVARLRESYSQVVDERNRLAVRVEAMDRDREKQKQQRESALERVMNANARLLEERDRLEKEKARVSELYQSTMGAMGAVAEQGARPAGTMGQTANTGGDAAVLEVLQAELLQKQALLAKREQEGESLRARLRKLAMV